MFRTVKPIGDSDPMRIPVRDVAPSVAFYVNVLGFQVGELSVTHANLHRDAVHIRLEKNSQDPEQFSLYIEVDDIAQLRYEYEAKLLHPSQIRIDTYGENQYQVFFVKEPYGVCFCFGTKLT